MVWTMSLVRMNPRRHEKMEVSLRELGMERSWRVLGPGIVEKGRILCRCYRSIDPSIQSGEKSSRLSSLI